jgi:hypothetical protein
MKETNTKAFWDTAQCSIVEVDRRFRGAYCLHYQDDVMEAVCSSETSVYFNEATRRSILQAATFKPVAVTTSNSVCWQASVLDPDTGRWTQVPYYRTTRGLRAILSNTGP